MAVGKTINLNFQHACYCNVASNYGFVQVGSEPAGGREPEWSIGLGALALSPYYSIGSPYDGPNFAAPTLKLLTLRTSTLAGYEVGEIADKMAEDENVLAENCGLSNNARRHGKYAPFLVPLERGGEGKWLTDSDGEGTNWSITNVGGMMVDFNTADLYTQPQGSYFAGYEIFGRVEHDLGPSPCSSCGPLDGIQLLEGPWNANLQTPPRILGKGWADIAQDNPKVYGQSEIYWNWPNLTSPKGNTAGTVTIGTLESEEESYSWTENLIRPLPGAPIKFQTIPFCYESCERAYSPEPSSYLSAKEIPNKPLYKNGYFHSLVSDPVFYRYREGSAGASYDDSNKDSQQEWLPHHNTNIVLRAEDPRKNDSCVAPYPGLAVGSKKLVCSGAGGDYVGDWRANLANESGVAEYRVTYGFDDEGNFGPLCSEKGGGVGCVVPDPCPDCNKFMPRVGYGASYTDVVSYQNCCWETTDWAQVNGGTVGAWNKEGKWVPVDCDTLPCASTATKIGDIQHLPPGEAFYCDAAVYEGSPCPSTDNLKPLWKLIPNCTYIPDKTQYDIGQVTFGEGLTVSVGEPMRGKSYLGDWDKKTEYSAGNIVTYKPSDRSDDEDPLYYKSRKNGNKDNEPKPRDEYYTYHTEETLADSDGSELETQLVKQDYDEWWELACEKIYTTMEVSAPCTSTTSTISVSGGYFGCDPNITELEEEESLKSGDVRKWKGQVYKALSSFSAYPSYLPGVGGDWEAYTPNFCATSKINLGSGLYFDYGTTPGSCNYPNNPCDEGPSDDSCCYGDCSETSTITLRSHQMGIKGYDCEGNSVACHVPDCIEFKISDFAVREIPVTGAECKTTMICSAGGFSLSGTTGKCQDASGAVGVSFSQVSDLRLGEGLYIEGYDSDQYPAWTPELGTSDSLRVGSRVRYDGKCWEAIASSVDDEDYFNTGQYGGSGWSSIACPDCCSGGGYLTIGAEVMGISVSGYHVSGSGCGTSGATPTNYVNIRNFRLGGGLFIDNTASLSGSDPCDPTGYVTLTAAGTSSYASGVDCRYPESLSSVEGKTTGTIYNTGDFGIFFDDNCLTHVKTKGITITGSLTPDCSGSSAYGRTISSIKELRLGNGLYIESTSKSVPEEAGGWCMDDYVQIATSPSRVTISGTDCIGEAQNTEATGINFNTSDFCISADDDCEATISAKPQFISVVGPTGDCCDTNSVYPTCVPGSTYDIGDKVTASDGKCYEANTWTEACPDEYAPDWTEISCPDNPTQSLDGIKQLILGRGLKLGNYNSASTECCTGTGGYATLESCVPLISGVNCLGSSIDCTPFECLSFKEGDFCIETGTDCQFSVGVKGFTLSGATGTGCCESNINGVSIPGVKDWRLGNGLYLSNYTTGACCSGNYATINARQQINISGADCGGTEQDSCITGLNFNTGDFCVDINDECDGTIRTKGWAISGPTGIPCTGTSSEGSVEIEGVKDLRLGDGLYISEYSSSPCCEGNYATINSSASKITGMNCSGIGVSATGATLKFDPSSFITSLDADCVATITNKGALDISGNSGDSPLSASNIKEIRFGSGIDIADTGLLSDGCSSYVTITSSGSTGAGGTGCSKSVSEYWAGGQYWSPSDCDGTLHISGCSGISTSIDTNGVLSVCYTGSGNSGCTGAITTIRGGDSTLWSASGCNATLSVTGCSGISTTIDESGVLSICYTGTGAGGTGCSKSVSEYWAGGQYWGPSDCDGTLHISGCSGISTSIDSNGVLSICNTGACTTSWGMFITDGGDAGRDYLLPSSCSQSLEIFGSGDIETRAVSGESGWQLYIAYTGTGAGGTGCSKSFSNIHTVSWVPDCENATQEDRLDRSYSATDCNDDLDFIGHNGVVVTGGSGFAGGGATNPSIYFSTTAFSYIYDDANDWAVGKSYPESSDYNRFKIHGCSGIQTRLLNTGCSDEVTLEICYTGTGAGGGGTGCSKSVANYWAGGQYWGPSDCEGALYVSGCSGIATSIDTNGVLSVCYTGTGAGGGGTNGCTWSGTPIGITGDVLLTNEVDYSVGGVTHKTVKSTAILADNYPAAAAPGCGKRTFDSHNGIVLAGGIDANNSLEVSTSAYALIADDANNFAIGKNYAQHGSSALNFLRIKGSGDVRTTLLNTGASQDTTLLIEYTGGGGGGGGSTGVCPDAMENIYTSVITTGYVTVDTSSVTDFNSSCWVSGDRVCIHGTNNDGTKIYVPATITSYSAPDLRFDGDFSNNGIKNFAPTTQLSVYHGPCAMAGNALEQSISICIDGADHEGKILFNPN